MAAERQDDDRTDQNKKISETHGALQVHIARASQMQARLLSALDKMDALRATHARELAAERRVSDNLSHKLERHRKFINESRAEWDDTREALSVVIEKVELANDYSLWPHNQLSITAPLEPMTVLGRAETLNAIPQSHVQPYARAVIASLREELEAERKAHSQTLATAEAQILSLKAQLARREAELELHGTQPPAASHGANAVRLVMDQTRQRRHLPRNVRPSSSLLTQEDAIQILEITAARNRELENEVRHLLDLREQARGSHPEHPHPPPQPPGHKSNPEMKDSNTASQHIDSAAPRPAQAILGQPEFATPHCSPNLLFASGSETNDPDPQGSSCASDTLVPKPTAIQQLQQLISLFATQLNGFAAERGALKAVLLHERQRAPIDATRENASGLAGSQGGEHHRLSITVQCLTDELEAVRETGRTREAQLQEEVDSLRAEVLRMGSRGNTSTSFDLDETARVDAFGQESVEAARAHKRTSPKLSQTNLLEEGGDECSMELATPLQQTIVSVREDVDIAGDLALSPSGPLPPPLIPLPSSPHDTSHPPFSAPSLLPSIMSSPPLRDPPPWWPHPRSPQPSTQQHEPPVVTDTERRMELIERELALARQELEAKNEELSELREVVDQLRDLVYSGSSDGEKGIDDGGKGAEGAGPEDH